ncbi:MAG: cation transporter [Fervidicoccaceae archaeon]
MERRKRSALIYILAFSFLGGAFKIYGGIVYNSKSVLVDALTSVANYISLVLTVLFIKKSFEPPDKDHHFGHYRLKFGGSIFTLMTYSFVAGIALMEVISPHPYEISPGAPVMAAIGLSFYLISIELSRRSGDDPLIYYSKFTFSEIIEGVTVIFSSLLGVFYSYIIDYLGSVVLTGYILYELSMSFRELILRISDLAPPEGVVDDIKRRFIERGVEIEDIKMRYVDEKKLEGHLTLIGDDKTREEMEKIVDEAKREVLEKYEADLFVEIKEKRKGGKD